MKQCELRMNFQFPEQDSEKDALFYPSATPHVQIKSTTIPQKLLGLLLKKLNGENEKAAKEHRLHGATTFDNLDRILRTNNLVPVFTEMPSVRQLLGEKDEIKMFENAGKIKITLRQDKFECVVEFTVPEEYPRHMVKMKIVKANVEQTFMTIFETHAHNVIRRLWLGKEPGYDKKININEGKVIQKKGNTNKIEAELASMQVASAAEMKHDVAYLHRMADLRNGGDMNKADRKFIKLNIKHEVKYEENKLEQQEQDKYISENLDKDG